MAPRQRNRSELFLQDHGDENDVRKRISKLEAAVEFLYGKNSPSNAALDFRALDPSTGIVRMIMSSISLLEEFGIQAHFAGFNASGTPTFYVDADNGGLVGVGGAYTLNELGIKLLGVSFVLEHLATVGSYDRKMRQGFVEIGGKPAWQVEFIDAAVAANLFTTNPDFETGSLSTGFSAHTNWAISTDRVHGGTYSAKIEQDKTNPLTTNKYAATAGNSYRFRYYCDANHATGILTGQVLWYNAVPTLLQTDTIHVGSPKYGFYERSVTLIAPAGATQCEMKLYLSTAGPAGYYVWVDDLSMEAVTKYRAIRLSDTGVEILDETGTIWSSASPSAEANRVAKGTGAITATEAFLQWQTTRKALFLYDGQRERALSEIGWLPYAYPIGATAADALTTGTAIAANGGSVAIPIRLEAPMLLESVSCVNDDAITQRSWNWALYEQYLNNGNAGENTLTRLAAGNANDTFTGSGVGNVRTITAASAPVYLPPGLYWLVFQNVHATSTFSLGRVGASTMNANTAQIKTVAVPLASTLDFVAATWTKNGATWGVRLNGRVFGQTAAF